jgi:hypothetical protein
MGVSDGSGAVAPSWLEGVGAVRRGVDRDGHV